MEKEMRTGIITDRIRETRAQEPRWRDATETERVLASALPTFTRAYCGAWIAEGETIHHCALEHMHRAGVHVSRGMNGESLALWRDGTEGIRIR